jgi:hypothetical protein
MSLKGATSKRLLTMSISSGGGSDGDSRGVAVQNSPVDGFSADVGQDSSWRNSAGQALPYG